MSMSMSIQGQPLEITVVSCSKLKDKEWISRQDPYVCLEYGNNKSRTRTCTDGGKNPVFQEKFIFPLIEGLRDLNVLVWNSNTVTFDDYIGTAKIQLHKVLSQGYDDSAWPLQSKTGRYAGEVKLILHYAAATSNHQLHSGSNAPPYGGGYGGGYGHTQTPPSVPLYSAPPSYPPAAAAPSHSHYAPPSPSYPPQPYPAYPASQHSPSPYPPPSPYPYPYPPPSSYPPSSYPPPPSAYPPPAPAPGIYPPPPY